MKVIGRRMEACRETVTSDDDFIENSQFASVVTITYNGTTATVGNGVSGVEVSSNGAHIVVNSTVSGVEYVLNGTTTNGSFKVYSEKEIQIITGGGVYTQSGRCCH